MLNDSIILSETGSGLNGTFHETMSSKEEEERFLRLSSENEELKLKIADKERQIEDVKKKIEQMTLEQMEMRRAEEREKGNLVKVTVKKAVRIQEPKIEDNIRRHSLEATSDSVEETDFDPSTVPRLSKADISESYL